MIKKFDSENPCRVAKEAIDVCVLMWSIVTAKFKHDLNLKDAYGG